MVAEVAGSNLPEHWQAMGSGCPMAPQCQEPSACLDWPRSSSSQLAGVPHRPPAGQQPADAGHSGGALQCFGIQYIEPILALKEEPALGNAGLGLWPPAFSGPWPLFLPRDGSVRRLSVLPEGVSTLHRYGPLPAPGSRGAGGA